VIYDLFPLEWFLVLEPNFSHANTTARHFNQVYILPLVIVTFTHKVLTVPFIGMILQAPAHWHHVV